MIELRMVEKIVPRQFYKYLKVFEKKKSKRVPTRKTWNHAVDLREGFVPKKGKIYPLSTPQTSPIFFILKKDRKKRIV